MKVNDLLAHPVALERLWAASELPKSEAIDEWLEAIGLDGNEVTKMARVMVLAWMESVTATDLAGGRDSTITLLHGLYFGSFCAGVSVGLELAEGRKD